MVAWSDSGLIGPTDSERGLTALSFPRPALAKDRSSDSSLLSPESLSSPISYVVLWPTAVFVELQPSAAPMRPACQPCTVTLTSRTHWIRNRNRYLIPIGCYGPTSIPYDVPRHTRPHVPPSALHCRIRRREWKGDSLGRTSGFTSWPWKCFLPWPSWLFGRR